MYSDYTDSDTSQSFRSVTPADVENKTEGSNPTPPTTRGTDADPVVKEKSIDILLAKYAASGPQEEPDPTTAPILDSLAPQLAKWFHGYMAPSEIKRLQDKVERPSNAPCLKPVKINAELYYAIASEGIQKDRPLSYVGQAIAKGCQPLAQLWSDLVAIDTKVKDATKTTDDTVAELMDGVTVNISQLHDKLTLALMIIGNANVQVAQLRRDHFKQYIHYDYHELLRHTNPIGENIFGDNLNEKIGDLLKIKQVTSQIKPRKRRRHSRHSSSFLGGRGGGCGRSYHKKRSSGGHCASGRGGGSLHSHKSHHHGSSQYSSLFLYMLFQMPAGFKNSW